MCQGIAGIGSPGEVPTRMGAPQKAAIATHFLKNKKTNYAPVQKGGNASALGGIPLAFDASQSRRRDDFALNECLRSAS